MSFLVVCIYIHTWCLLFFHKIKFSYAQTPTGASNDGGKTKNADGLIYSEMAFDPTRPTHAPQKPDPDDQVVYSQVRTGSTSETH
jgi:hypothetical protein